MAPTSTNLWLLPPALAETVLRDLQLSRTDASLPAGAPAATDPYSVEDGVAVIEISGALTPKAGWATAGYADVLEALRQAETDPAVGAVLLDVDSPGGTVAGCQELAQAVAGLSKPCAAYTGSLMASAAYWIGSATGRVYATETAELGSIGVVMTHADYSKALEEAGLAVTVIASGEFKAAGSPYKALTEQERAYFQAQVDSICAVFKGAVASAMGLDLDNASAWAEGRVLLGSEAATLGLTTAVVGGRAEAIAKLQEAALVDRATLSAQHPELVQELLAEGKASAMAPADMLACIGHLMSAEDRARAEKFFQACAGLSGEQVKALAEVAFPARAEEPEAMEHKAEDEARAKADADSRAEILAGIQAASPQGVAPDASATAQQTPGQLLNAAMDKIGAE